MRALIFLSLLVSVSCVTTGLRAPDEIAGVNLEMTAAAARAALANAGQLTRTETSLNQEIWTLRADPSFTGVIVGFDANNRVRFITGIARPEMLRYTSVVDPIRATRVTTGNVHRYTWLLKARRFGEKYKVIAIGSDREFVHYLSLKRVVEDAEEKD